MQRLIDSFVASPIALVGTGRDAIITAVAGPVIVLVLRAVVLALTDKVDRQRDLYSKAFRAALAWKEMLYRVRRRTPGSERDLIERFHELQEEIDYFEGWTASEGRSIGRSYCRLVREIKRQTQPLIREAWSNSPRPTAEPAPEAPTSCSFRCSPSSWTSLSIPSAMPWRSALQKSHTCSFNCRPKSCERQAATIPAPVVAAKIQEVPWQIVRRERGAESAHRRPSRGPSRGSVERRR